MDGWPIILENYYLDTLYKPINITLKCFQEFNRRSLFCAINLAMRHGKFKVSNMNNFMELSSLEADSRSANQEVPLPLYGTRRFILVLTRDLH
jgi:hypothetical protein